ncbi:VWA-like domain-containing protein [Nocardiopsis deserti]|uniref:VWA-like domain-containing protein n=1 Tax=Nocardiopsis deserti TaxID=2605988 RepID=UPI00123BB73C|nr:VWA-like domain-containing protein [Nocardiopsis deserti]
MTSHSAVRTALALAVRADLPVLLWGAPGTGKTSAVAALGRALELPVEVVVGSVREPSDFSGLPVVRDDGTWFAPPRWAERLAARGLGLLFLDELTTAPPAVQAAMLRVVLERAVGDLDLPEGVRVVAAANPRVCGPGRRLRVVCCDLRAHPVQTVRRAREIRLLGGGGTDLREGIAAAVATRPRPDLLLVLTDGHTPWPGGRPPVPVAVGLVGGAAVPPPPPDWAHVVPLPADPRHERRVAGVHGTAPTDPGPGGGPDGRRRP